MLTVSFYVDLYVYYSTDLYTNLFSQNGYVSWEHSLRKKKQSNGKIFLKK